MKRLAGWISGLLVAFVPVMALAQEQAPLITSSAKAESLGLKAMLAISAALAIAIAALGGALGQGKVAATAMDGIARNPEAASKVMTPMIIALALIESLVIYALVIAFLLQGKI
jgi:F-type H+-transporting ATPase subunit c